MRNKLSVIGILVALVVSACSINSFMVKSNTYNAANDSTKFSLINSTNDLEVGKSYIITNGTTGTIKAIAINDNTNNRKTTEVTVSNGTITRGSSVMSFTLGGSSGSWTFATENYAGDAGYLASASSGNNNYLRVIAEAGTATISFSGDEAVINVGPHTSRTQIRYNSSDLFACYSTGQNAVYLWKEVDASGEGDPEKDDVALSCNDVFIDIADSPFELAVSATSEGNPVSISPLTYEVSDDSIATVSDAGVVTPVSKGNTTLTISFAGDEDYNATSKTINVRVSDATDSSLVFTAACGGSGTADDGAEWSVSSDGTESNFDNTSGIHYGTGSANVKYLQLSTSSFTNFVRRVVVNARDAQAVAEISVTVGGKEFVCSGTTTLTNTSSDYTFTGYATGEVIVRIERESSMVKALYVKSVDVKHTADTLQDISLSGNYDIEFDQNGEFNHTGMIVTGNFSDGPSQEVTLQSTWIGYDLSTPGNQEVTVICGTKSTTYNITVVAVVTYSIGGTISNGSLSSTANVRENNALNITINADNKYSRPAILEVTMGENSLSLDNGYTYNSSTGAFHIEHVTGNVVINGVCAKIHGLWEDDPFTVQEAIDAIDDDGNHSVQNAYVFGIISQIDSYVSSSITYWISDDGSTTNQLEVYKGLNKQGETAFSTVDDIEVGATVVVSGNLTLYSSTHEFAQSSRLTSYTAAPRYTVTFNSVGGDDVDQAQNIKKGTTLSHLPVATKANDIVNQKRFVFDGWFTVANPENPVFEEENRFTTSTAVNSNMTVYAKYTEISYYVVSFNTNGGNTIAARNVDANGVLSLPDDPIKVDALYTYTFEGWYKNDGLTEEFDDSEHINSNMTLFAKYTTQAISNPVSYLNYAESTCTLHGNEITAGSGTIAKTINALTNDNNWTVSSGQNATCYPSFDMNEIISISTTGTPNCGSVWGSTTKDWRLYQNQNGNVVITANDGYNLSSVTITYNISNTGTLKYGNDTVTSGTSFDVDGSSITFTVGNTAEATNGQVKITAISVSYERAYTVSGVAIRFGASIPKSAWDAINDNFEDISDYGVMLMTDADLEAGNYSSIQEAYEDGVGAPIMKIFNKCAGGASFAVPYLDGENYIFKIVLCFPADKNYYDDEIHAVPFVVVGDQYYFLDEMNESVLSLATAFHNSGNYALLSDEALQYLMN